MPDHPSDDTKYQPKDVATGEPVDDALGFSFGGGIALTESRYIRLLERFPPKWEPVRRRKRDQVNKPEARLAPGTYLLGGRLDTLMLQRHLE